MIVKTLAILSLLLAITTPKQCFGEECAHRANLAVSSSLDHKEISQLLEKEIQRQFWNYLRDSDLIYQANLELPNRLITFYFHRSVAGTFFTIASFYDEGSRSEINTMVRLGNGYTPGLRSNSDPVSIEPFTIGFRVDDNTQAEITMNDG